jgi:hypothetical protein
LAEVASGVHDPRLGGRVVERLVVDGDVAGLVAHLLEGKLDAVDHGGRLRARSTLQRKGRVDGDRGGRLASAFAAATAAAARIVIAAGADAEGQCGNKTARRCQRT